MRGNTEVEGKVKNEDLAVTSRHAGDGNYVLVYSHHVGMAARKPSQKELSALVVTKTGDVYGAGVNSLVGGGCANTPMKDEAEAFLKDYVTVDHLSGRNIKKIVVGFGFGAALIGRSNEVMVWSRPRFVGEKDIIRFQGNIDGSVCKCTSYSQACVRKTVGGIDLNYCDNCGLFKRASASSSNQSMKEFILFREGGYIFSCSNCSKPCSYTSINNIKLHYCTSCKLLLEKEKIREEIHNFKEPHKIVRVGADGVVDIACTKIFICMLFESNKIVLQNFKTEYEFTEPTVTTSGKETLIKKEALYGEGDGGLLVKSEEGNLYKCLINENNPSFNLNKIELPAAVNKVCSGSTTSAVLLADGSVWFIKHDCGAYRLKQNTGGNSFADIAVVTFTDFFLVKADEASVIKIKLGPNGNQFLDLIVVNFLTSELDSSLLEMAWPPPPTQPSVGLTPNVAQLYGQTHLSDLTIKLSDGDFPAHSSILFLSSAHFQEAFGPSKSPPKVLDMSEYNPKAYRNLLQRFYQVKPDDLDAGDLIDLRQIATSYGETAIAAATAAQIKAKLTEENVMQTFARAKHFDYKDVMNECEKIMFSPTFKDRLLQVAMQNLTVQVPTKQD